MKTTILPIVARALRSFTAVLALVAGSFAQAAPTVALSAPPANGKYFAPASLTVSASASPSVGTTLTKVEFFSNGSLIGSDTTSPFSIAWATPPAGSHVLTAVATDSAGATTTSTARTITVVNTNTPPAVTLSAPAANAKYFAPASITVSASASDTDLNTPIAKVEFFSNGALIGSDTTSPYSIAWATPPAGSHVLTAVATDSAGASTTSVSRTITVVDVNTPPTVALSAPAANAKYFSPASITVSASASDTDLNTPIAKVDFFSNGTLIGSDTTSPYSIAWATPPAGSHVLTAVATDSAGATTTSTARTITVVDTNTPPAVTLSAPAANAKYFAPASVTVSASASDTDLNTPIAKVDFFSNGTLIGSDTTSPYSIAWATPPAGSHVLTAVATDSAGATTTSTARTITVVDTNTPPAVTLSAPAANAKYFAPASITVSASASDTDLNTPVAKVEFFSNGTLIGSDTTSPYSISWTTPPAGNHALTAVATDSAGGTATSTARTITVVDVNTPPTVAVSAPAANAKYFSPASITVSASASDTDLNTPIAKVEFFQNGTLIGSDSTSPYSIAWATPPAGTHILTAVATDSAGATTTSVQRTITVVDVNTPPAVALSTPAANASFVSPAAITVSASASDTDINTPIAKVDFFANGNLIGSDTTSPYSISWANPPAGSHVLTAVATDSAGATTTSAARTITVTAPAVPPTVSLDQPAAPGLYLAPASLTLSATAAGSSPTKPVTKVEFLDGATLLATVTTAPYTFTWTGAVGVHAIAARATDSAGTTAITPARTITINAVNAPPTVALSTPADGASLFAPASVALTATADGIELNTPITKVEFFADGSLIGSATTSPYTLDWTAPPAGIHLITAVATDSAGGVTTSAARTITIVANQPPVVSLASPSAGQTFTAPIDVPLAVSVSDPDTPIVQVEYRANGTPIGSAIAPPWTATWPNAPAGTHAITALATDALGATATSAPVSITVGTAQAKIYYLHTDHLDTPRLVTDAANTVVWRHLPTNEPFGDGGVEEDPGRTGQAFEMPLAFPGQYRDKETGLSYNFFRDYDPGIGRYVQSDPIGLEGGINTYTYVGGNPISRIDSLGLFEITAVDPSGRNGPTYGGTVTVIGNSGNSVTVPGSTWPNPDNPSPGIQQGEYAGTYGPKAHQGMVPGVTINDRDPVITLAPNSAQGGQSFAKGINLHCGYRNNRRGSAGCITIDPAFCESVWNVLSPGETGTITITRPPYVPDP